MSWALPGRVFMPINRQVDVLGATRPGEDKVTGRRWPVSTTGSITVKYMGSCAYARLAKLPIRSQPAGLAESPSPWPIQKLRITGKLKGSLAREGDVDRLRMIR